MQFDVVCGWWCVLGLVAIAALYLGGRRRMTATMEMGGGMMPLVATDTSPDIWATPYYLRYNTPVADTTMPIMPSVPGTFALATWYPQPGVPGA